MESGVGLLGGGAVCFFGIVGLSQVSGTGVVVVVVCGK